MALKITKNIKGVDVNYWIIKHKMWDKQINAVSFSVFGYVNRQARIASLNNAIASKAFKFNGDLTTAELYTLLKQDPYFVGSEDE